MILLFVLVLVLEEHSEHLDGRSGWCEQARGNDKKKKKTKKKCKTKLLLYTCTDRDLASCFLRWSLKSERGACELSSFRPPSCPGAWCEQEYLCLEAWSTVSADLTIANDDL